MGHRVSPGVVYATQATATVVEACVCVSKGRGRSVIRTRVGRAAGVCALLGRSVWMWRSSRESQSQRLVEVPSFESFLIVRSSHLHGAHTVPVPLVPSVRFPRSERPLSVKVR